MTKKIKTRPQVGIGVIVKRGDKILIGKRLAGHGAGTYEIPGGHLEFGETFARAAIRETVEETGLTDIVFKEVISLSNDIAYDKHYISIGVVVESTQGEPTSPEPDCCGDWQWLDPRNLPEPFFPHSRQVINNWLAGKMYIDSES